MSSSIKLTNANGKILTITNPDSLTGDSHMNPTTTAYTIETVDDFGSVPSGYTTVIVKDSNRGGTFTWSSTGTANGGTVFAGLTGYWNRQYDGAVNVDWFGANKSGDCTSEIRACFDYVQNKYKTLNVNDIYFTSRVMIEFTTGTSYIVNGDNVLAAYCRNTGGPALLDFGLYIENKTYTDAEPAILKQKDVQATRTPIQ